MTLRVCNVVNIALCNFGPQEHPEPKASVRERHLRGLGCQIRGTPLANRKLVCGMNRTEGDRRGRKNGHPKNAEVWIVEYMYSSENRE